MLVERIARFLCDPQGDSFDELALAAFAFQYERVAPYRTLCDGRGVSPATVRDWREVPAVPALAMKRMALHADEPLQVFRSSGTTRGATTGAVSGESAEAGGERSTHYQPYPDLYHHAIDCSFPRFCLPSLRTPAPMLSLVPTAEQAPDSSLAFMAAHVFDEWGAADSTNAFGERGVDVPRARSWLGARQREGRPALIFATSFALAQLLEALARRFLHFRLAPGSVVFDTGGYKGRHQELSREDLLARIHTWLGVPPEQVVREYGMTELSSQCYTTNLLGGDPEVFVAPHWVRVRALHPETLAEQPPGEPGLLAVFDLANVGSVPHLLTEDLGATEDEGFRLLGRAGGAELRGCSLTVEELSRG
ncbi:MAG TPA: long-chain fatty acid--CoA ligase [Thermoanaerobaculia bacterium]|nr:long-chain fatty acid--CoA ligase [Thermoanaerobaculia bacterium]